MVPHSSGPQCPSPGENYVGFAILHLEIEIPLSNQRQVSLERNLGSYSQIRMLEHLREGE